jgi:hypothetical protein
MTPNKRADLDRWELNVPVPKAGAPLAPHRPVRIGGLAGYVEPIGVRPGERLRIHLSAPAAHRIEIARLGRDAILLGDDDADRAEVVVVGDLDCPRASRQDITPGSYAWLQGASVRRPAAISAWLRLWRLPVDIDGFNFAAVIGEMDYPYRCHWVLAVDNRGCPGFYLGDGGLHDRERWAFAGPVLASRLGEWVHLACSTDGSNVRVFVDGICVAEAATGAASPADEAGVVRIAAAGELGVVDHLLDGDLSAVVLFGRPLRSLDVVALFEDRSVSEPAAFGLDSVIAHWPLRESSGDWFEDVSGGEHHASAVNAPILGIPGPCASESIGRPGYMPLDDPMRGGAVRFASDELIDCRWPVAAEAVVPAGADTGTYYVRVTLVGSDDALELPFVVVRPMPRRVGSIALLYATFTWAAYARRPVDGTIVPGLVSSFYTNNLSGKPFFNVGFRLPLTSAVPFAHTTHRAAARVQQHLVKPERLAEAWLAREGYPYECITDADLDQEPELLDRFRTLMIVGHNEYWSRRMRDGIERYLDQGGDVICLSGNTAYWRVTYHADTNSLEGRKTNHGQGAEEWLNPTRWGERWHTDGLPGGSWEVLGEPPNQLLGLETIGWIDPGDPTAFAPYTIQEPDHFLFHEPEPVPIGSGGLIGTQCLNGTAVSGYEMDGLPQMIGMEPAGPTDGLALLAHAHQGRRYVEHFGEDPTYGGDMIYWKRPSGGRLFNAASIAYSGSLAVDPAIQALTRNVLHHFGVQREA